MKADAIDIVEVWVILFFKRQDCLAEYKGNILWNLQHNE